MLFEDKQLSYAELLAGAESVAARLAACGLGPGDSLALVMDNSLECVLAWLASSLIGCTEVPINPQYRAGLLHHLLAEAEVSAIVCDASFLPQIADVAAQLPLVRRILINGSAGTTTTASMTIQSVDFQPGDEKFANVDGAAERIILYTSGTTGPSKGVVHTQRSMLALARYNAEVMGYNPEDRLLNFFPLFHQNARYTGVIPALCTGASIRVQRRLSTSTFWKTCAEDRITAFNYLGSVLRMILNATGPEIERGKHTVLRAFGAGAAPSAWAEFEERLGIAIYETYGLSEAPMATLNLPEAGRPARGSAGRASALFEIAVVDGDDNRLQPGEVGEIVLRPRRSDVFMAGYHKQAGATVAALRNLWFHSGDRGHLSAEGALYFEERAKDSIRRRGENISAWEVESVLEQHPAVVEAAVYSVASPEEDEEVAASLVAPDGDLAAIACFARERLPAYAVPTLMRLVPDLPRTPTQKVRKEDLRRVPRHDHVSIRSASIATDNTHTDQFQQGRAK